MSAGRSEPLLVTASRPSAASLRLLGSTLRILLIEDDAGDATLVRAMLEEVEPDVALLWVRSIAEALPLLTPDTDCVLLDLQLPDATGFSGLDAVLAAVPGAAVIVLTGFTDSERGVVALARGAQDYLNKASVEPDLLARAIRYALERRVAQDTARELAASQARAAENTRLERGLLPVPVLEPDDSLQVLTRYRPGRQRALLGGDFYDVVQCLDGPLYAVIGDVSGHGPDEAALGVCLRIAWRTLVLAGTAEERILPLTAEVLGHERSGEEIFATVCMLRIAEDRRSARVYLAGHPPPILLDGVIIAVGEVGAPLGVDDDETWTGMELALPPSWSLMLYTDGLIEGTAGPEAADGRLGVERLGELLATGRAADEEPSRWIDALIDRVEELNDGPLTDDLAVLILSHQPGT